MPPSPPPFCSPCSGTRSAYPRRDSSVRADCIESYADRSFTSLHLTPAAVGIDRWPLNVRDFKRHIKSGQPPPPPDPAAEGAASPAADGTTSGDAAAAAVAAAGGSTADSGDTRPTVAGVRPMQPGMFGPFLRGLVPRELRVLITGESLTTFRCCMFGQY